jgi:hypothetical protein
LSLEKSNEKLTADNQSALSHFYKYKQQNLVIVAKVDSINWAVFRACNEIALFKKVIVNQDSLGQDIAVTSKIIHGYSNELLLKQHLTDVYNQAHHIFAYVGQAGLDSTIKSLKEVQTDTAWTRKYFGDATPSMAAVTTLSKLQNDCLMAEQQSLLALQTRIVKK